MAADKEKWLKYYKRLSTGKEIDKLHSESEKFMEQYNTEESYERRKNLRGDMDRIKSFLQKGARGRYYHK